MAITYKQIATITVSTATAADIEFTNIPGIYTDLVIKVSARDATSAFSSSQGISFQVQFNGSTSNLSGRNIFGNGTGASSNADASNIYGITPTALETASTFSNAEVYIPNYAGGTNKSVSIDAVAENNATGAGMRVNAGLWSNTAAITSIKLVPYSSFVQYSSAVLYGIKKA